MSTNNVSAAASDAAAASAASALTSGDTTSPEAQKDEFLQILLTQLQHQNPTDPVKPEEFATQLAQFSALEQQVDTNTKLDTLIANTSSGNISPTSYLGNVVQYSSATAPVQGGNTTWNYTAAGATTVTLTAKDASGAVVYTGTGDVSTGTHTFTLPTSSFASTAPTTDSADGTPLTLTVTAADANGNAITPIITSQATVTAVDSSSGSAILEASGYGIPVNTVTQIQSNNSALATFSAATTDFGNATSAFTSILNALTGSTGS